MAFPNDPKAILKVLLGGHFFTVFLAFAMLFTGTINTVSTKFQDVQIVKGTGDGPPRQFEHAFFQTAIMFVGEFACLFVWQLANLISKTYRLIRQKQMASTQSFENSTHSIQNENDALISQKSLEGGDPNAPVAIQQHANPLVFWIPAFCDLSGTTLLNFGLILTYASVYQMLRGSVVIFNAIFSCIFLRQMLGIHKWIGIALIFLGLLIVGASSTLYKAANDSGARNPFLGNILVVVACVLQAVQFVVEEKFVGKYDASPLECVGWEGFFGLSMTILFLFVLYWIPGNAYMNDARSMENAPYAFAQMFRSPQLMVAVVGSATSIAFFNFIGISITKRVSSTTRSTIDACRTMFIWAVSLLLGWETFQFLQLGGFAVLVTGTFVYNEVIRIPIYHGWYLRRQFRKKQPKKQDVQDLVQAASES